MEVIQRTHRRAVVMAILLVGMSLFLGLFSFGILAAVMIPTTFRHWWHENRHGDSFEVGTALIALVAMILGAISVWWLWDDYARWKVDHPGAGGPIGPYTMHDRWMYVAWILGVGVAAGCVDAFVRVLVRAVRRTSHSEPSEP
jgi:hypothetical protein